jgi:ribosomal protein S18 acetylase RimI-like enzyme
MEDDEKGVVYFNWEYAPPIPETLVKSAKMITLRECTIEDTNILAEMNKQLIEDERATNTMDIDQLKERMAVFIKDGYKAFLFTSENTIIGYSLIDMTKEPVYLRHFFIKREERRRHYGKESFRALIEYLKIDKLEIDVYDWNDIGKEFWKSLGFKNKWTRMKYKKMKVNKTVTSSNEVAEKPFQRQESECPYT